MQHQRNLLVGSIGVIVLVLGLYALINQQINPDQTSQTLNTSPNPGNVNQQPNKGLPPQPIPPSFEIVHLNKNGSGVFSGTATPGAEIRLTLDRQIFGRVIADSSGDWLYTFAQNNNLHQGQHVVYLQAVLDGYSNSPSQDEKLLIDLPLIGTETAAGNTSSMDAYDGVVIFAHNAQRGLRVLQRPGQTAALGSLSQTVAAFSSGNATMSETLNVITNQITGETPGDDPGDDPVGDAISASLANLGGFNQSSTATGNTPSAVVTGIESSIPSPPALPTLETAEQAVAEPRPESGSIASSNSFTEISLNEMTLSEDSRTITIRGAAEANARLSIGINQLPFQTGNIDGDGRFTIRVPSDDIMNKEQTITMILSRDNQQLQTIAAILPPVNIDAVKNTTLTETRTVTVQKGETLWAIAVRAYGDGTKHRQILEANSDILKSDRELKPGMILRLP